MATDTGEGGSSEQRVGEFQDSTCSTCSTSGEARLASHYCPDCDVFYCKVCLCDHVVIGRSKIDQWGKATGTDVTAGKAGDQSDEDDKLKCLQHPQYDVALYCEDHDIVCCRLCPSTEHRSCINMEKIIVAADAHNLNDDIKNISKNIDTLKRKADYLGEESEIKKQFTESSHTKYISQLLEMQTNINAKVDQIKKESNRRKQHYIDKFNMDQFQCTDIKDKVPKLKRALEPSPDKAKDFIKVKRTKEFVAESNKKMSSIIGTKIKGVFDEMPLEGERKVIELLTSEAQFQMSGLIFRVRIKEDKGVCEIVGICQIGNGNLVLADKANKHIKQLNRDYTIINHYELPETPNDVCAVDETEVAIAMQNKTVLIINVGTAFEIVRSLEMTHGCLQVAYHDDKIYFVDVFSCCFTCNCNTKVYVYEKNGENIAEFETSCAHVSANNHRSVVISQDGQKIYVAHPTGYITSFNPEGTKVAESKQFNGVVGMCTDDSDNLFACNSISKAVLQLSQTETGTFKKIKTVLSLADRDTTPRAMCYDEKLGRVVIGSEKGDYIYLE